ACPRPVVSSSLPSATRAEPLRCRPDASPKPVYVQLTGGGGGGADCGAPPAGGGAVGVRPGAGVAVKLGVSAAVGVGVANTASCERVGIGNRSAYQEAWVSTCSTKPAAAAGTPAEARTSVSDDPKAAIASRHWSPGNPSRRR